MDKKNLITTIKITFILFSFIIFLIYLLYCYAYYDKYQEQVYHDKISSGDLEFFYTNLIDKDGLLKKDFDKTVEFMLDNKNIKDIYYLYYRNSGIYSLEEFTNKYYYGDYSIAKDGITFAYNGKTNLFRRRAIFFDNLNIVNKKGYKVSLGVKRKINFLVEEDATLKIDNQELKCEKNKCILNKAFGGLHELIYSSNGYEYYGIINITKDNQEIEVTNLESLVRIDEVSDNNILVDVEDDITLKTGNYKLSKCYLDYGCPSSKKSYIKLNEDGTCEFYTYISLDKAGDLHFGKYRVEDGFLIMNFDSHTYQVFDYDTKESTDINAEVDIELRYKIVNSKTVVSDDYKFIFSE